jgi:hypothetical protein
VGFPNCSVEQAPCGCHPVAPQNADSVELGASESAAGTTGMRGLEMTVIEGTLSPRMVMSQGKPNVDGLHQGRSFESRYPLFQSGNNIQPLVKGKLYLV